MTEKAKNPPLLPRADDFTIQNLRLDQIVYDCGTQMRTQRSAETIEAYREKYEADAPMPEPVAFFDDVVYRLADGFHRCEGAALAKKTNLDFKVYRGGAREAVLYACGANEEHGLRRDRFAKRKAALTCILDSEWGQCSSRWIASVCNVNHAFVARIREEWETKTREEANGGPSALEWAKGYCRNPNAKPGEAKWVPPWQAVDTGPARSTQEPPIDVPESFRPDHEHSPPLGCGTIRVDDEGLDTYPVTSGDGEAKSANEPAVEYRTSRDGSKRPAKGKPKPPKDRADETPEEAVDFYGSDDAPADGEDAASYPPETSTIGEPLNDLTAPAFAQLPEFADLHRVLSDVMKRVDLLYDSGAACYLQYERLKVDLTNCRNEIYGSRPHALCPECGGEGCHRCRQSGFIPAAQYLADQKRRKRDDRAA